MRTVTRTADEVEAELGARQMPGGERTWLDVVAAAARVMGTPAEDVCARGRSRDVVRARALAWTALFLAGYSYPRIASAWGYDNSTVFYAVRETRKHPERIEIAGFTIHHLAYEIARERISRSSGEEGR